MRAAALLIKLEFLVHCNSARKTHQRLKKISFVTPKRLFQRYLPLTDEKADGCNRPVLSILRARKTSGS